MIQQLITLIINQLVTGLNTVITTPATRITQGPVAIPTQPQRPRISIEAAEIAWQQSVTDDTSGQPRNLESRERIVVSNVTPQGPYALGHQPLEGSVAVVVVRNEGLVTEYSEELLPGTDFTVNLGTSQLTIVKPIVGASALRVVYTFVGNASVREFEQEFFMTIYLDTWTMLNQLVGLCSAIVHSRQALLLDQFNFQSPTNVTANNYFCSVMLSKIKLLGMEVPPRTSSQVPADIVVQLNFSVQGTTRMGVALSGGFGTIQSIHSQGQSGPGVNIQPNLG